MAYVRRPKRKLKWHVAIPLLCLIIVLIYMIVHILFPKQDNEEFDIDYEFIATKKQTKEVKAHKEIYKFMSTTSIFDHFEEGNPFYPVKIRIIRIKIGEDNYESIITNLDRNEFPTEDIKFLYGVRWGIETSFRELKYAVGLNAFHAKNREYIKQEIYAKLLFYNFSEKIIRKIKPKKTKILENICMP